MFLIAMLISMMVFIGVLVLFSKNFDNVTWFPLAFASLSFGILTFAIGYVIEVFETVQISYLYSIMNQVYVVSMFITIFFVMSIFIAYLKSFKLGTKDLELDYV